MCIGRPARVLHVANGEADVELGDGRTRRAGIASADNLRRGDYVLLYADLITEKIDRRSALETLKYMKVMAGMAADEDLPDSRKRASKSVA